MFGCSSMNLLTMTGRMTSSVSSPGYAKTILPDGSPPDSGAWVGAAAGAQAEANSAMMISKADNHLRVFILLSFPKNIEFTVAVFLYIHLHLNHVTSFHILVKSKTTCKAFSGS